MPVVSRLQELPGATAVGTEADEALISPGNVDVPRLNEPKLTSRATKSPPINVPTGNLPQSPPPVVMSTDADVANLNAVPVTREFRALRLGPAAEWAGPTESVGEEVIPGEARRGYGEACRPVNLARRNTAENADLGIQGIAGISGRNLHVSVDQVSPRVQHIRVRYGRWNSPGKHGPDARDLWHFATGVT